MRHAHPLPAWLPLLLVNKHISDHLGQGCDTNLFAYADDSTVLAVIRKPANRPAVAAFLNRDLEKIQEWYNHWCLILNPIKIKALVVSRSRTVNPSHGDLVLCGVSI